MRKIAGILLCVLVLSCATMPKSVAPEPSTHTTAPQPVEATQTVSGVSIEAEFAREMPHLSWEKNHPERRAWSEAAFHYLSGSLDALDMARDTSRLHPQYSHLTREQRIALWAELISATAYYESGWNPRDVYHEPPSLGVDSIGLMQVSVEDQSAETEFHYTAEDLKVPEKNLRLSVAIFDRQVRHRGLIFLPHSGGGCYWSTLCPGHRNDKSQKIIGTIRSLRF